MHPMKILSEMRGSLRILIIFALGGVVVASLAFLSQRRAQRQINDLQVASPTAYIKFHRRELHDDPQLDLLLHRLKDTPSVENLVESHELLLERATDPESHYDRLAWTWLVGVISKHAEIHGTDTDIWDWFVTDVLDESNHIMVDDLVRQFSICVLREQGDGVPDWMLVNEMDIQLATTIAPLQLEGESKSFAEIDAEMGRPVGEDQ